MREDEKTKELAIRIDNAETIDELRDIDNLFKVTRLKKELNRLHKYEELQDMIVNTIYDRVEESPHYIRNEELINFLKATQSSIDRSTQAFDNMSSEVKNNFNQTNNTLNVTYVDNSSDMTKESRERIHKAVLSLMGQVDDLQKEAEEQVIQTIDKKEEIEIKEVENYTTYLNEEE